MAVSTGITKVEINYITNVMMVQYDPDLLSNSDISKKIRNSKCNFVTVGDNFYSVKKPSYSSS
jgi:hypothetical protein